MPELALQDTVRYQEHLFRLLIHNDDRALRILSIYGTIIGLLITVAFALNQAKALGPYPIVFMATAAVFLALGCVFAYLAGWSADIYLPGRKPDFWKWALDNDQDPRSVVAAYIEQAAQSIANNERISNRAARRLERGYVCGVLALPVATIATILAYTAYTFIF